MRHLVVPTLVLLFTVGAAMQTPRMVRNTGSCTVRLDGSPALRGVKLGMTSSQVVTALKLSTSAKPVKSPYLLKNLTKSAYFREKKEQSDGTLVTMVNEMSDHDKTADGAFEAIDLQIGESAIIARTEDTPELLAGVKTIMVRFFNDRAHAISATYVQADFADYSDADFRDVMAGVLNVPPEAWTAFDGLLSADCLGFDVTILRGSNASKNSFHLTMNDSGTKRTVSNALETALIRIYEQRRRKTTEEKTKSFKPE